MNNNLPKIALVGRPNVGKSALFNCILKKRVSIVDEQEGVTRDRLYAETDLFGRPFIAIDTGGIDPKSKAEFNDLIKAQAEYAIQEADSLILVVDAKAGLTALDQQIAELLLKTKKPVSIAVNKVDSRDAEWQMAPFFSLGITNVTAVSASQNWQIAESLEKALAPLEKKEQKPAAPSIKIAIVGRPNVGKSTLINQFLNDSRTIVSPIAGTTRDSIDIPFCWEGEDFILIDTAGIRKKGSVHNVIEKFAAIRTQDAIEKADVCILVLDSQEGITAHEKRIAKMIEESGKGCVIVFNKWDLVKGFRMEACFKSIEDEVAFLLHCPKLFISAKTGRNVDKVLPAVKEVNHDLNQRITTGQLNRFVETAIQKNHPPMIQGRRLRIYYLTQTSTKPPKFTLFVNKPELMIGSYRKYLQNQFRQTWRFSGVPLTFQLRKRT